MPTPMPDWIRQHPAEIFATDERNFGVYKKRHLITIDEWFALYIETGLNEVQWHELLRRQRYVITEYCRSG